MGQVLQSWMRNEGSKGERMVGADAECPGAWRFGALRRARGVLTCRLLVIKQSAKAWERGRCVSSL